MSDYTIRPFKAEDRPQLAALWKTAFGDSDACIDAFFDLFLKNDGCLVAEADDKVVSAMYIVRGMSMNPYRRRTLTAGYAYALATLPEYRGRGIGTAVYRAVNEAILQDFDCALVLPAEESLYPFYEKAGAFPISYRREARFTREELRTVPACMCMRATYPMYSSMREGLLDDMPHVSFPEDVYDFMESQGCEFFFMGNAAACTETIDGVCYVRELIDPATDHRASLSAIATWCPAKEYVVYSPAYFDGPGEVKPYMLSAMKQKPTYSLPPDMWCAFGLE